MQDAVQIVVEALIYAGFTDVHPNGSADQTISKSAMSSVRYVWVQELPGGTTPHIRYSDRPTIEVITYSNLGVAEATLIGRQVQKALQDCQGQVLPSGGIHRVITVVRPHREDLAGLQPGVGRSSAQYDLILSSVEKWV